MVCGGGGSVVVETGFETSDVASEILKKMCVHVCAAGYVCVCMRMHMCRSQRLISCVFLY